MEGLSVSEGVISLRDDPTRTVTYGELIGGGRFAVALTGGNINATTGVASIKPVQDLKLVGQSIPRYDIPGKVDATLEWAVDVSLPGMVHARHVRPPFAGATLVGIDESSVRDLPGFIRVVSEGNYVAVVFEREEQAIEAAERLVVEWEKPATAPFPASDDLFDYMRSAERVPGSGGRWGARSAQGDPDGALASAATVVEAAYDIPFHGHTAIGPGPRPGRPLGRPDDHLHQRHEAVQPPDRDRRVPGDGSGAGAGDLDGRAAALRAHCGGRRGVRGRVPGQGAGPPGAGAVDAARGDGVGHQGPGLRHRSTGRAGRGRQRGRAGLSRADRQLRARRVQPGPHRADRRS